MKGAIDYHCWFWGTQAMFQLGGQQWQVWNKRIKEALVQNQRKRSDGCQ